METIDIYLKRRISSTYFLICINVFLTRHNRKFYTYIYNRYLGIYLKKSYSFFFISVVVPSTTYLIIIIVDCLHFII